MRTKLSVAGAATALLAACCATLVATGTANATPPSKHIVTWTNVDDGQHLNVSGNSHAAGAAIITWKWTNESNEKFYDKRTDDGNFEERPMNTVNTNGDPFMCMDAAGGAVNAKVIQWPCNNGVNQRWKQGKQDGHWWLENQAHKQFLTSTGARSQVAVRTDCGHCLSQAWD
ncbi:RICIN domain-containing protein [Actinocrispum wychmicini]|uniref:Ricin-type beta-trefoil lectin protein n=1 Tax=Actinocrispum wychmicini TaxID=1213861 RepID=A0A4R2J7F7_9PSEU|nr:RICIN domain-containing protein [Actinocrispum wychmicini]TCO54067.1 ricin-type beta-trefoil lectin protein [Actinocrispum wychmicini]